MSYKELKTYQSAVIIYDFTVEFCDRYIDRTNQTNRTYHSRMWEQMVQAARSGKQNIVEASTERTSKKSELKLLGVSRASFQELLEDYEDFLRQRNLRQWDKDEPEARKIRQLYQTDQSDQTHRSYLTDPEKAANCAICLINQENYLLDRQIKSLEEKFIKTGGWNEQLYQKRKEYRGF